MSETKFVKYFSFSGVFYLLLGLLILITPKITPLNFSFILCLAFILFGGFKTITGILNKNIYKFFYLDILLGLITTLSGVLLFFAHTIDIMFVIMLVGIFFILQSICSSSMSIRIKTVLKAWYINYFSAFLDLFFGTIVITILSPLTLWLAGILFGINLLIKGILQINMIILEEYNLI